MGNSNVSLRCFFAHQKNRFDRKKLIIIFGGYIVCLSPFNSNNSKTCLKQPLKRRPKIGFQDRLSLNAGQKYCRMLQKSILKYFRPSLSYHLSFRLLFCLYLSGSLRQWPLKTGFTALIIQSKTTSPEVFKFIRFNCSFFFR